jgi:hypothetical protein
MARRKIRLIPKEGFVTRLRRLPQQRRVRGALPYVAAVLIGGAGTVVAAAIGAGELLVGAAAAYAGYKYLTTGETAPEAAREGAKVAQGKSPRSRKAA